jgi:methylated-DNA-[protein]-cysteine S-methyltransferase
MIVDTFDSPLGQLRLCCDGTYLTAVTFAGQKYEDKHIPKNAVHGFHPILERTKQWLSQYFSGIIPDFLPPIILNGTPFQKRVWELLLEIPYGKTITYGELAKTLECKSAQAVGGAVGRNPISILIPCHRVLGADGSLTGYAGGLEKKEALLKLEKDHLG